MKNKIRILHIEERFHPLMGYQVNFFAKYHSQNIDFHILSSKSLSIWNTNLDEIKKEDSVFENKYNIKIHRVDAILDRPNKRNILLKGVKKQIDSIKPDIVFLHAVESFTALMFFLRFRNYKNIKIVTDTHTLYNQFKSTISSKFNMFLFKKVVVKKINKNKIISFGTVPENVEILKKSYGIYDDLVIDLPIGTDFNQYKFSAKFRESLRNEFLIDDETTVLLYTGKFDRNKQPHLIIDAIKEIENSINQKLLLFFVGAKPSAYYDEHFSSVEFLNKNIKIHVLQFVDSKDLFKYYSMADFAVLPTENSLSAIDMQACKLPVIMQNDTTNADRLKNGGLVFSEYNINELSKNILKLLNDNSLIKTLGENGYLYVKEKFDYIEIVKKLESILFNIS
ncbi:MAG: glycosyltransferase family 4 protein [Bacteroidales bacterium]|nr:glycosyltransferase family 4 protein [Bacteroidales bacterium]